MPLSRPTLTALLALLALPGLAAAQCVSLASPAALYAQDFDTLATSGSTNALTLPGWQLLEGGGGSRDNGLYDAGNGSSSTGDTYSFGASGSSERALGALQSGTLNSRFGVCFTNNTGGVLDVLGVAFVAEQWRSGTASREDRLDFEYSTNATGLADGSWTAVDDLDALTVDSSSTGTKDGNASGFRAERSANIGGLGLAPAGTIWIRWVDFNASGADDGLAVDDLQVAAGGLVTGVPKLTIADVALAEGGPGESTVFRFVISLSEPAPAGGVGFDITTVDGSASAGSDYVANAATGQVIAAGETEYLFDVQVTGDDANEGDEAFTVVVSNLVGAIGQDTEATGAILNDDFPRLPIHALQGSGNTTPYAGQTVATDGIVTGLRSAGFFIQTPDAEADADPATSQGIYVYTGTAPPPAAAVGNRVQVVGQVVEYTPSSTPNQLSLTEITGPSVLALSTGQPLPAPVVLDTFAVNGGLAVDGLERYEGMRVAIASLTVVAPVDGSINEAQATSTSNGIFYAVPAGTDRPFREAGISALDTSTAIPPGKAPPVFDTNPERLQVNSRGLTGAPLLSVDAGDNLAGFTGILDYGFGSTLLYPDPAAPIVVTPGAYATAVAARTPGEATVAGFNLLRFFDDANDPAIGEPVLTPAAYANRLAKTANAICAYTRNPDILGVVEVESLPVLQDLAAAVNSNAGNVLFPGSCSEDPGYAAYLVEGNDVGGIDVGFLVSTAEVRPGVPRVEVLSVTQVGKTAQFTNPDTSTETLNDRPPLVLEARINHADGSSLELTVIANHLRSLNDVDSTAAGSSGWATRGERVRAKRAAQAVFLASLVHDRQLADPSERIVLVGDFNAFEFNDGFADLMGIITGREAAESEVLAHAASPVATPLTSMTTLSPAGDRYSFSFQGSAQTLDHVVVNQALLDAGLRLRTEHARINADWGKDNYGDFGVPVRVSDHDPVVLFISPPAPASANLGLSLSGGRRAVAAGGSARLVALLSNRGPDAAVSPTLRLRFNLPVSDVKLGAPAGWTCTEDTGAAEPTLDCSGDAPLAADGTLRFDLRLAPPAGLEEGTLTVSGEAASATDDPQPQDNGDAWDLSVGPARD